MHSIKNEILSTWNNKRIFLAQIEILFILHQKQQRCGKESMYTEQEYNDDN